MVRRRHLCQDLEAVHSGGISGLYKLGVRA